MPTALKSLISIPCKPLSRFSMALYNMYLLVTSCHVYKCYHFGMAVVHPLFPDTTNCINYTTEENLALTDYCSFIPLLLCLTFFERELIPGMQCSLVFLWHLLSTLKFICMNQVCVCGKYIFSPYVGENLTPKSGRTSVIFSSSFLLKGA